MLARQADDDHPQRVGAERFSRVPVRGRIRSILFIDPEVFRVGEHPQGGPARERPQHPEPRFEQGTIASEPVHDETLHESLVVVVEEGECPDQRREHPSPVDVGHHDDRRTDGPGEPEVDDVDRPQVDLGRTARTFTDHDVEPRPQFPVGVDHDVEERRLVVPVRAGLPLPHRVPEHDDLAAGIGSRLEQHRVHDRLGLDTRRLRLGRLSPADLLAATGDE